MTNGILRIAAWLLLFAVCFMTLGPIALRPRVNSFPVDFERLIAWACLGALFALAYPKSNLLLAVLLIGAVGLLELAQHLVLGRHGAFSHFIFKAAGALIGVIIGSLVDRLQTKWRASDSG